MVVVLDYFVPLLFLFILILWKNKHFYVIW